MSQETDPQEMDAGTEQQPAEGPAVRETGTGPGASDDRVRTQLDRIREDAADAIRPGRERA
jgi:hypothetical protein